MGNRPANENILSLEFPFHEVDKKGNIEEICGRPYLCINSSHPDYIKLVGNEDMEGIKKYLEGLIDELGMD